MKQPKVNFCVRVSNEAQRDAVFAIIEAGGGRVGGSRERNIKDVKSIHNTTAIGYAWASCFPNWQGNGVGKDFHTVEEFAVWYLGYDDKAKERVAKLEEIARLKRELTAAEQELADLK
jgi:hypothetical protein